MPNSLYAMSPAEIEILKAGSMDPNIVMGYFFKQPGQELGWQFDHKFDSDSRWQEDMCLAEQTFIVVIGGVSTGKTLGVGMAAAYLGMITPDFKFLNIARESWQSALMYSAILEHAQGTPFEKLITASPQRPYPKIILEYMIGVRHIRSTLEFMSIGEKEDATNIFSWRGDWLNVDEAGRLDNLAEVTGNLSTRGTGSTPRGRPYMGRMSLISNPWENPELWQLFDIAVADSADSLAINVETKGNRNTTEKQIKQILKLVPERDRERFLTGKRPEGRGTYFSREAVDSCTSQALSEIYRDLGNKNDPSFIMTTAPQLGTWHLQVPRKEGRIYFLLGDPGTGVAPARNAPVVMVFDVTDVPNRSATMVALYWGNGNNSIMPWTTQLLEWIDYYKPIFAGCDSTSTQKNMAEIISLEYIDGKGKSVGRVTPMDFSGGHKYTYLTSLRLGLETQLLQWPHICLGLSSQLRNYEPALDRTAAAKLPQDLVATLAMVAFAIRAQYGLLKEEESDQDDGEGASNPQGGRRTGRESPPVGRTPRDSAGRAQS